MSRSDSTANALPEQVSNVLFALYGFQLSVPENWRVEMNPKGNQKKGDVAFHSPKGNRFFVSWGVLDDALKRFKSLDEHRDTSINQVRKGPDVAKVYVSDSREEIISGHRALYTRITASVRGGFMSRSTAERVMWSVHFYCPDQSRYYIIYCLLRDNEEYPDIGSVFRNVVASFSCHKKSAQSLFAST